MLTGDNGLLTKANESKVKSEEVTDLEMVRLAVTTGKLENITEGTEINAGIQNELRKTDNTATVNGDGDEKEITYNGRLYNINIKTGTEEIKIAFKTPNYNDEMKKLKQKDYILYDTGKEGTGKVLCRVLYDASSEYGLQIITEDCIKKGEEYVDVSFGSRVSWGYEEDFEKGVKEYNSVIETLNKEANQYLNKTYAIDARCVGSNPKNKKKETKLTVFDVNKVISDTGEVKEIRTDTGIKDADDNYVIDYEELENLTLLNNTNKSYWLASRYNEEGKVYNYKGIHFFIRSVGSDYIEAPLRYCSQTYNEKFCNVTNGLRPVFLLNGDLKIEKGDGSKELPYELEV